MMLPIPANLDQDAQLLLEQAVSTNNPDWTRIAMERGADIREEMNSTQGKHPVLHTALLLRADHALREIAQWMEKTPLNEEVEFLLTLPREMRPNPTQQSGATRQETLLHHLTNAADREPYRLESIRQIARMYARYGLQQHLVRCLSDVAYKRRGGQAEALEIVRSLLPPGPFMDNTEIRQDMHPYEEYLRLAAKSTSCMEVLMRHGDDISHQKNPATSRKHYYDKIVYEELHDESPHPRRLETYSPPFIQKRIDRWNILSCHQQALREQMIDANGKATEDLLILASANELRPLVLEFLNRNNDAAGVQCIAALMEALPAHYRYAHQWEPWPNHYCPDDRESFGRAPMPGVEMLRDIPLAQNDSVLVSYVKGHSPPPEVKP